MHAAYLDNAYTQAFTTTITAAEGTTITLEKTYFYPTGGGQPCDYGTITSNNITYNVTDVKKEGENIIHIVDKPGLHTGATVDCNIDWKRRYQLMKMHTAMHLLCAVFEHEAGTQTTGNNIDITESRADSNFKTFNKEIIQHYIDQANKLIQQDLPVTISYLDSAAALNDPNLFKLATGFKHTHLEKIRIVSIGDYDRQADGGTHVKTLKELGTIQLTKTESKGKERKRVYFTLT